MHNSFDAADFVMTQIKEIKARVGSNRVICGISGGVDSTVTAKLICNAIGNNLVGVFINTGLLRKNEADEVVKVYKEEMGFNLRVIDARDTFLAALAGITDPEQKRKIIGKTYIDIFEAECESVGTEFLAQGSIKPDFLESDNEIKSHHNVGGLPAKMKLKLVEPVRDLFKDQVRQVANLLNLPEAIIRRHPSPGPCLAIRVIGEVTLERLDILREADNILIQELHTSYDFDNLSWYHKVSQAFCVLLPTIMSTGVVDGARAYGQVVALRVVSTRDYVTAHAVDLPFAILENVADRIVNEVSSISRVVYDITDKPPATIEWE